MRLIVAGPVALTRQFAQVLRRFRLLLASREMAMTHTRHAFRRRGYGWLAAPLLLFLGCGRSGVEIQRMPDGSRQFKCQAPLWKCLDYVGNYCKGGSYEVLYGRDDNRVYGTDQNHVEGHTSVAQAHCLGAYDRYRSGENAPPAGSDVASSAPAPSAPGAASSKSDGAAPSAGGPTVASAPAAPQRACVPGVTQACVGTAACSGGQACLPDGSGFGPCDCGKK
jgi:hypothetical protein